jgi:enamine deaminase RidA (YjgF/YER057c/UK114 family)
VGPYTPVVRAGGWLVVSGQVGLAGGGLVDGGVGAQLAQAIANLSELLAAEGSSLATSSRRRSSCGTWATTPP